MHWVVVSELNLDYGVRFESMHVKEGIIDRRQNIVQYI